MTERQAQFLKEIIESYTVTIEPVASGFLAKKSDVSSATIRNEMSALEEQGYIIQPHTSAGRIPTAKGYKLYLQKFLKPKKLTEAQQTKLQKSVSAQPAVKSLAKQLADLSHQTVLVAFGMHDYYYTGISNLFSQPEFHRPEAVVNISAVLDALDQTLSELYKAAGEETTILVGKENPFSEQCSLLLCKSASKKHQAMLAILGPLRMNYSQNIGLLNYSKQILNK